MFKLNKDTIKTYKNKIEDYSKCIEVIEKAKDRLIKLIYE